MNLELMFNLIYKALDYTGSDVSEEYLSGYREAVKDMAGLMGVPLHPKRQENGVPQPNNEVVEGQT